MEYIRTIFVILFFISLVLILEVLATIYPDKDIPELPDEAIAQEIEQETPSAPVEVSEVEDVDIVETEEVWLKSTCSAKTYMSVWRITDCTSPQWNYIHESGNVIIDEQGFLICEDEYIGVALGSYFGEIGSKYIFTMSDGKQLKLCKVEEKADVDTCNDNYMDTDGHVIEFVIDNKTAYMQSHIEKNGYVFSGNFNNCERFNGSIAKIERVLE